MGKSGGKRAFARVYRVKTGTNYLQVNAFTSGEKKRIGLFYVISFSISCELILFILRRTAFLNNKIQDPAISMIT